MRTRRRIWDYEQPFRGFALPGSEPAPTAEEPKDGYTVLIERRDSLLRDLANHSDIFPKQMVKNIIDGLADIETAIQRYGMGALDIETATDARRELRFNVQL